MRGGAEPITRPVGPARLGREQVSGDALGRGVLLGEHPGSASVGGRTSGRRELLDDRAADDRMGEAQLAGVGQDPSGAQRVSGLGGLAGAEVGKRSGVPDQRPFAEDRGRAREALRSGRKAREPRPHGRDDTARRGVECRRPAVAQRSRELAHEERVSAGQLMADGAERRRRARDRGAHDPFRSVPAERARAEHSGRAALREHVADRGSAGLTGRPGRDDDQHRQPLQPVREIREEAQRRDVGPVPVVDQERHRSALCERRQQPR